MEKESIPWMDDILNQSTSLPDVTAEEPHGQMTVVLFVISAVLTITLLFALALFIDFRQGKKEKELKKQRLRAVKVMISKHTPNREDKDCIIDNMEDNRPGIQRYKRLGR